jgi:hypothetical protein
MAHEFDLAGLRRAATRGSIHWHKHALERFLERGISLDEVTRAIMAGEVIAVYTGDRPFPSALIAHMENEPLHVVAAVDSSAEVCHVITGYRPDRDHFAGDFRTRRHR